MTLQVADPQVSRAKFERELAELRETEPHYRQRGWWVMEATFPVVQVAFVTPNCRPNIVALTARLDFTNYDLEPPSVQFVDMFEGRALSLEELMIRMPRLNPEVPEAEAVQLPANQPSPYHELIQGHQGSPAFLCLPGTREYHSHPAHTGDSWLLHRDQGAGRLVTLLDRISRYGSEPIRGLKPQVQVAIEIQLEIPS